MNALRHTLNAGLLPLAAVFVFTSAHAQVPVDMSGESLADYESVVEDEFDGAEGIPLLDATELEDLVGPVALYPDDLLAIVLPASTYPLQLVQAQRFLEDLQDDPSLKPDEDWDDSIIAVMNYPEVLELGSFQAARSKGALRLEGKDYRVRDADVILFRFNI